MIDFKKLRDLIIEKKCIASNDYGKDDPFVGIYWEDLVEIIKQCDTTKWISVEEALPECDKCHLAMYEDGGIIVAKYENETWWWQDGFVVGKNTDGDLMYSSSYKVPSGLITHWMERPQLKGGEK